MTTTLTPQDKISVHKIYLAFRALATTDIMKENKVFSAFEDLMAGIIDKDTWRPMFVSPAAVGQMLADRKAAKVRRAHGVIPGTLTRYQRTYQILKGPELDFDSWWKFYTANDWTVLVTTDEHNDGITFPQSSLIPVDHSTLLGKLFDDAGFAPSCRVKTELKWLKSLRVSQIHSAPGKICKPKPR